MTARGDAWPPRQPERSEKNRPPLPDVVRQLATGLAGGLWGVGCLGAMIYTIGLANRRLDEARAATSAASIWLQPQAEIWIVAAFTLSAMMGGILIALPIPIRRVTKVIALVLLTVTMLGTSATALRSYIRVADDQVLIHPALPWHQDIRFALADATVVERKCIHYSAKGGPHHAIVFRIHGGPNGGQTIDLGQGAKRSIVPWLEAMRDYANGVLPLSKQGVPDTQEGRSCMSYWLRGLDQQHVTELSQLLD
jgi:hypothetical protein